jgi:hypothetical protein
MRLAAKPPAFFFGFYPAELRQAGGYDALRPGQMRRLIAKRLLCA